jgi:lysophospholipase L1-like esterase
MGDDIDMVKILEDVAKEADIPKDNVVDSMKLLKKDNKPKITMSDTIHPSEKGYEKLAEEMFKTISKGEKLKEKLVQLHAEDMKEVPKT